MTTITLADHLAKSAHVGTLRRVVVPVKPQPHPEVQAIRDVPLANRWWPAYVTHDELGIEYRPMGSDYGEWKAPYQPCQIVGVREAWGITAKVSTDLHDSWIEMGVWLPGYMIHRADAPIPMGSWIWKRERPAFAIRTHLRVTSVECKRGLDLSSGECMEAGYSGIDPKSVCLNAIMRRHRLQSPDAWVWSVGVEKAA